jgi:DNA-binding NtrC family response regulator
MSPRGNRVVVFVVDDEPVIASTLELILLAKGYDARSFVDLLDALLVAQSVTPNLLISDVIMPQMNGFDLASNLTERHSDCKILMVSGQTEVADLYSTIKSKGCSFELMAEPVPSDELLSKIEELLQHLYKRAVDAVLSRKAHSGLQEWSADPNTECYDCACSILAIPRRPVSGSATLRSPL